MDDETGRDDLFHRQVDCLLEVFNVVSTPACAAGFLGNDVNLYGDYHDGDNNLGEYRLGRGFFVALVAFYLYCMADSVSVDQGRSAEIACRRGKNCQVTIVFIASFLKPINCRLNDFFGQPRNGSNVIKRI
jgi:hypothetical protein